MTINCGFERRKPGRRKRYENQCVTGIVLCGVNWRSNHALIRAMLMKHAPKGTGWQITGYANVSKK